MLSRLVAAAALAASFGLANSALGKDPQPAKTAAPVKTAAPAKTAPAGKAPPAAKAQAPAKTPAVAPAPAKSRAAPAFEKETAGPSTPAKQRQKACGAEWRGFSAADKTAEGPTWPQFYSKCVKRLKAAKKE